MWNYNRRLSAKVIPVLMAVAIIGYLAGGGLSSAVPAGANSAPVEEPTANPNLVVLDYPISYRWWPASGAPTFPGLPLSQALVLAPRAQAAQTGLIVGQIGGHSSSPLPQQFLARTSGVLRGEVVNLMSTQAYRYSQLSALGSYRRLTVYAIPNAAGTTTVILCYASQTGTLSSSYLRTCEQIAAQLTLQAQAQSRVRLTPEAAYAHRIALVVGRVDQVRASIRPVMRSGAQKATLAAQAKLIAGALTTADASLSALQPPAPASVAHKVLSAALLRTHDAYLALAAAASESSRPNYRGARTKVYEAEAAINSALQEFAQLGYG